MNLAELQERKVLLIEEVNGVAALVFGQNRTELEFSLNAKQSELMSLISQISDIETLSNQTIG